jgi:hypothetical protein
MVTEAETPMMLSSLVVSRIETPPAGAGFGEMLTVIDACCPSGTDKSAGSVTSLLVTVNEAVPWL